jgi:hypothetical protein
MPHEYMDVDSDSDFLDLPEIRYNDGTSLKSRMTPEHLAELLDPAWREKHGLGPVPKLPPPVDH